MTTPIVAPILPAVGALVAQIDAQVALNSVVAQTNAAIVAAAAGSATPTGPASGDLSGSYPSPTVRAVHATSGTLDGVIIGNIAPANGAFGTVAATSVIVGIGGISSPTGAIPILTSNTAAKFDNSNKVATTAFVQGELGNSASINYISASVTLTGQQMGVEQVIKNAVTATTITLPATSTVPVGSEISFINTSTYKVILTANASDSFFSYGSSTTIGIGDTATLVAGTNLWYVKGGSLAMQESAVFGAFPATNGWQLLPSGLIMNWGSYAISGSADTPVTFMYAFPNGAFTVTATANVPLSASQIFASVSGLSSTGFIANCFQDNTSGRVAGNIYFFALGH